MLNLDQLFKSGGLSINSVGSGGLNTGGLNYNSVQPGYNPGAVKFGSPTTNTTQRTGAIGSPTAQTGNITQTAPSQPSEEEIRANRIRGEISGGYDNYFRELDNMVGGLGDQRNAQEGIITNNYNQGVSDLNVQNEDSQRLLASQRTKAETNKNKNLRDLADNIINQQLAGSVYLGSRGAGDSSAANQYSYALTKMGNKQRGDVIQQTEGIYNDINDREARLKGVYTQELSRLNTDKSNKFLEVAQWFSEAQNQLRSMKASGQLDKSKDLAALSMNLLSSAMSRLQAVDQDNRSRRAALETWAMNNSKNLSELRSNMAGISNYNPALPQVSSLTGTPSVDSTGNYVAPVGMGVSTEDERNRSLFG